MPQKKKMDQIIRAIREYIADAVMRDEPITDERLIIAAHCARATFYRYVTKGSGIESEIEAARVEQKKYQRSREEGAENIVDETGLRERPNVAEVGNRELLALLVRMRANLNIRYGIPEEIIQAAQRDEIPHPDRSVSNTRRGRRKSRI